MKEKQPQQNKDSKKVIDADNNTLLELFDKKDTEKILKHYKAIGKWNDVAVDRDGDIILWEN